MATWSTASTFFPCSPRSSPKNDIATTNDDTRATNANSSFAIALRGELACDDKTAISHGNSEDGHVALEAMRADFARVQSIDKLLDLVITVLNDVRDDHSFCNPLTMRTYQQICEKEASLIEDQSMHQAISLSRSYK